MRTKIWTKMALSLSACLFILWWALGTGATLAWFSSTDTARNQFDIGLLQLDVSYSNDDGATYLPLQGATKACDDKALYEPGYTQVVYLKIDNTGDMDFQYKCAVTVDRAAIGYTALGDEIYLPDYLRCGIVFGKTEDEVRQQVKDRLTARSNAPEFWSALGTWSDTSPYIFDAEDDCHYAALIVYMPESVENEANYRGFNVPWVELGITVSAQQVTNQ